MGYKGKTDAEYKREYYLKNRLKILKQSKILRYNNGSLPLSENKACSGYLGCYIAERMLLNLFKNVERVVNNNPGYDFKCDNGYLIEVKSSCKHLTKFNTCYWIFHTKYNIIADYFLFFWLLIIEKI